MGLQPTERKEFIGLKMFGPNVAIRGAVHTELNLLMSNVPNYYQQATGRGASGWVLFADMKLATVAVLTDFNLTGRQVGCGQVFEVPPKRRKSWPSSLFRRLFTVLKLANFTISDCPVG